MANALFEFKNSIVQGLGAGPVCLLNSDSCLDIANQCYGNEECCSGNCMQIAVGGGICLNE